MSQERLHGQRLSETSMYSHDHDRRDFLGNSLATIFPILLQSAPATAYTPDSDPLRESLYLMSRVQEATVQQERFATNTKLNQQDLKAKLRLSLRLVEKSYRLVDQINYSSQFINPTQIVAATEVGYQAAESLQTAIDFVKSDELSGSEAVTKEQRTLLQTSLQATRQDLCTFLDYLPSEKLKEARLRIEKENVDNRDEFDGPDDAGVYNPVKLPWK